MHVTIFLECWHIFVLKYKNKAIFFVRPQIDEPRWASIQWHCFHVEFPVDNTTALNFKSKK